MEVSALTCDNCKVEVSPVEIHCENCGYPLAGTEKEKALFIGRQIANKSTIREAGRLQRRSSYILYAIGGLQIFSAVYSYMQIQELIILIITVMIGAAFIAFGYFSTKKPILFVSLGLGLILFLYTLDYIFDPNALFRGILWKIIIISTLIYTLVNSFEEQKIKKSNKSLKD